MNGVLLIDKPSGMTSHDVVAWARRRLNVRGVGHAGTLDPMATGVLVLLVGSATRLASLLTGKDKTYLATVRLGIETDTADADGTPVGRPADALPSTAEIRAALDEFVGPSQQVPPAHSAKRVGGTRAYVLARHSQPVSLPAVPVTVRDIGWIGHEGDLVQFRVTATAGFYVRSLARDLGARLGCGGHLAALRRTASGDFTIDRALPLGEADGLGPALADRLLTPADALTGVPTVRVTALGLKRVRHGNFLEPVHLASPVPAAATAGPTAVLDGDGQLIALAEWRSGALHPVAVLG